MEGKFVAGTNGWGYVSVPNPSESVKSGAFGSFRPFQGSRGAEFSNSTFARSQLPIVGTAISGAEIGHTQWNTTLGAAASYHHDQMQYRLVGMSLEVFPESSFMNQNGSLSLCEFSGHVDANYSVAVPFTSILGYENTRIIRATQTGSQNEKIIVNWHPRMHSAYSAQIGRASCRERV